tara:strand:- start:5587 stop:7137 length:1551 start_codon:yes stop_codon:yes gene_type:complete
MESNRRQFLKTTAAGLAMAAFSPLIKAGDPANGKAAIGEDSWAKAFQQSLEANPWLSGYKTASQNQYGGTAKIQGRWPKALTGTLYRNGPAQHEIGGVRYHHYFDGDGMLHAYRFSAEGVKHQAKIVETRKYKMEQEAGRVMYPTFGTMPNNPSPVTSPDLMNVANISVLPHHGKLMALWEAGSPWEVDAESLDTVGRYSFSSEMEGVPFAAHPRVEPDGTLWNFGYLSSANLLVLWHIDANGKMVKAGKISSDPISMPHDFVVTRKHIVLMMPPLNYQKSNELTPFLDNHKWEPDQATRILVVDKNDFSQYRWLELPSQWVFHFGNAWEDEAGVIRFDGARAEDPSIMTQHFRSLMRGEKLPSHPTFHHQYRIDTNNWTISEAPLLASDVHSEFPVIDPRVSTKQYHRIVMMTSRSSSPAIHGNLNEVSSFDFESGKLSTYRYPDTQIPEEHLFIPSPDSALETEGWVVGTAHDWQDQTTVLNVFDISAVEAGPIAVATLPYSMPLGLHGKFVQS